MEPGSLENPGQIVSLGVPRVLKICMDFEEMYQHLTITTRNRTENKAEVIKKQEVNLTLSSCSTSFFPLNSGHFATNSPIMHPTDHISTAVEYSFVPKRISGALEIKK